MYKYIILPLLALTLFTTPVLAQEAVPDAIDYDAFMAEMEAQGFDMSDAVVVATTELYNAAIAAQEGNTLTLTFDLYNDIGVQPGVMYVVQLQRVADDGSTTIVDTQTYPDRVVSLGEQELVPVSITYNAPAFLAGEYTVMLYAYNQSSMLLALNPAGTVTLAGTGSYVELADCHAALEGSADTYALSQGVDLATDETLTLVCTATNHTNTSQLLTPHFDTHERLLVGNSVATADAPDQSVALAAGVSQTVTLVVPTASQPQAYDTVVTLTDGSGATQSNEVVLHYVIAGASATIQNAVFDQVTYEAGDSASLQLYWTLAADSFPDSRLGGTEVGPVTIELAVTDQSGTACAEDTRITAQPDEMVTTAAITMTKDCAQPVLGVILMDSRGTVLADRLLEYNAALSYTTGEGQSNKPMPTDTATRNGMSSLVLLLVLVVMVLVIAAIVIRRRNATQHSEPYTDDLSDNTPPSGGIMSLALALLLAGGMYFGGGVATVEAWQAMSSNGWIVTVSPQLSHVHVGQSLPVTVSAATVATCTNSMTGGLLIRVNVTNGAGQSQQIANQSYFVSSSLGSADIVGWLSPGEKTIPISFTVDGGVRGVGNGIGRTYVVQDGVCGSATAGSYTSAPTANLCAVGAASGMWSPDANTYRWICNDIGAGAFSGTNATCNATRLPVVNGACGVADSGTYSSPPSAGLCSAGSATGVTTNPTTYTWSCTGTNGGSTASCDADRPPVVANVNGVCGSADGATLSVAPTTNRCTAGNPTSVAITSTKYSWSCTGTGTGSTDICEADRAAAVINGSCGTADTGTYATPPATNLCSAGTASGVTTNPTTYTWSCTGSGTGATNASCDADRSLSNTPPVVSAGDDRQITQPTDSTTAINVSVTDPDGSIASILWTQVSGPAASITNGNTETPTFSNLATVGTYRFRLTATDNNSAASSDDMEVVVNAAATPRLIVCPNPATVTIGSTVQLTARYWSDEPSIPTCATTGYTDQTNNATWSSSDTALATVSNTVGTKGLVTGVAAGAPTITANHASLNANRSVTVNEPFVNGVCGSADGEAFSSTPASGLCSAGSLDWDDNAATDGVYNWTCEGSGGGGDASCVAARIPTLSLDADPDLVRSGESTHVTASISASWDLSCQLLNVTSVSPETITHLGTVAVTQDHTVSTKPISYAQIATLSCPYDAALFPGLPPATVDARINVVPGSQEI